MAKRHRDGVAHWATHYPAAEVANMLHVDPSYIVRLCQQGVIDGDKLQDGAGKFEWGIAPDKFRDFLVRVNLPAPYFQPPFVIAPGLSTQDSGAVTFMKPSEIQPLLGIPVQEVTKRCRNGTLDAIQLPKVSHRESKRAFGHWRIVRQDSRLPPLTSNPLIDCKAVDILVVTSDQHLQDYLALPGVLRKYKLTYGVHDDIFAVCRRIDAHSPTKALVLDLRTCWHLGQAMLQSLSRQPLGNERMTIAMVDSARQVKLPEGCHLVEGVAYFKPLLEKLGEACGRNFL